MRTILQKYEARAPSFQDANPRTIKNNVYIERVKLKGV